MPGILKHSLGADHPATPKEYHCRTSETSKTFQLSSRSRGACGCSISTMRVLPGQQAGMNVQVGSYKHKTMQRPDVFFIGHPPILEKLLSKQKCCTCVCCAWMRIFQGIRAVLRNSADNEIRSSDIRERLFSMRVHLSLPCHACINPDGLSSWQ